MMLFLLVVVSFLFMILLSSSSSQYLIVALIVSSFMLGLKPSYLGKKGVGNYGKVLIHLANIFWCSKPCVVVLSAYKTC